MKNRNADFGPPLRQPLPDPPDVEVTTKRVKADTALHNAVAALERRVRALERNDEINQDLYNTICDLAYKYLDAINEGKSHAKIKKRRQALAEAL